MTTGSTGITSGITSGSDIGGAGRPRWIAALGAVGAALLASVCCIGPVLFVTAGVGAGLASRFEPLRPVFVALTVVFIAAGFYTVYGKGGAQPANACEPGDACDVPRHRTRDKVVLWVATVLALVLLTFPRWSLWLL